MSRGTRAVIDLDALRHNLRVARQAAPHSRVLAVVKADGYGHGLRAVAGALAGLADGLGVATFDEGMALRDSGVSLQTRSMNSVDDCSGAVRRCISEPPKGMLSTSGSNDSSEMVGFDFLYSIRAF